jgi:hypothetical protein
MRPCQESKHDDSRPLLSYPDSVRTLFATTKGGVVEVSTLNIRKSARYKLRDVQPRWSSSIKIVGIVSMLLLSSSGLHGSRPTSQEPVTVTFLDVEWEAPDRLPGLAKDLEDFTRETGIQVKRLPAPDGSLNQLVLWRELLQKGASAPDIRY